MPPTPTGRRIGSRPEGPATPPPGIVDVRVLRKLRVRSGEALPVPLDHGEVEPRYPDGPAEDEDQAEVEHHPQPAQQEAGLAPLRGLLACLEKLVHRPSGPSLPE